MTENKANAISVSLLNRKIYAVCYTGIDTLGAFHGALYNARRRFLETGKTARVRAGQRAARIACRRRACDAFPARTVRGGEAARRRTK